MSATATREEQVQADQQAMEETRAQAASGDKQDAFDERVEPLSEASLRRLRASQQLSFDLGVRPLATGAKPDFATVKVAGSLSIDRNLLYGQHVTVQVVDHLGEVVAEGPATVGYPGFKDHFDKQGTKTVERLHTATIDKDE